MTNYIEKNYVPSIWSKKLFPLKMQPCKTVKKTHVFMLCK